MAAMTATTTEAIVAVPNPLRADRVNIIQNLGPSDVFIGPAGVTAATGIKIAVGGQRENVHYVPYVITASGTADVRYETA